MADYGSPLFGRREVLRNGGTKKTGLFRCYGSTQQRALGRTWEVMTAVVEITRNVQTVEESWALEECQRRTQSGRWGTAMSSTRLKLEDRVYRKGNVNTIGTIKALLNGKRPRKCRVKISTGQGVKYDDWILSECRLAD